MDGVHSRGGGEGEGGLDRGGVGGGDFVMNERLAGGAEEVAAALHLLGGGARGMKGGELHITLSTYYV